MKEDIIKILKQHLSFKFMEDEPDVWRFIENNTDICVNVEYAHDFVIYQNAYFSDIYEEFYDLSLIIYNGGTAIGIWPLSLYVIEGKFYIGSWGKELLAPLLCETGYTIETKRKLYKKCISVLDGICKRFNIKSFKIRDYIMGGGYYNLDSAFYGAGS